MTRFFLFLLPFTLCACAGAGDPNHVFRSLEEARRVAPDEVHVLDLSGSGLDEVPEEILEYFYFVSNPFQVPAEARQRFRQDLVR